MLEYFELFNKLSTEWSLKKTEYFVLNGLLCDLKPKNILEFGPGNSTIVLSKNAECVGFWECPGFEDKSRFNTVEFASRITNKIILHDTKREQNTIEYFKKKGWNELKKIFNDRNK